MIAVRLFRAGFHGALLFLVPWGVGVLVGVVFDTSEVKETGGEFATYFAYITVPLLFAQLVAISVKVARERRELAGRGRRGLGALALALERHLRVLTGRGLSLAAASLIAIVLALSAKWAQLGVIAVAGLGLNYLFATAATLVSAFSIRAFDDRIRRGRGSIDRELQPSVIDAGDPALERFVLARVPVPPGFRLHIEEKLPARLGGETRFALDRGVSGAEVTVSAPLPRTPRGVYELGPAEVWYEDVLGLTRVRVASRASASLRVLPRLRPLQLEKKPRSLSRAEGALSMLSRLPTEEHYGTRAYVAGDDLRRVHWKLSVNTGTLQVRVPEAVPFSPQRVRLVLDSFLPPGLAGSAEHLEDLLDLLVEGWVSLAHALARRGEKVSLCVAARNGAGQLVVHELDARRGEERRWRALAAEIAWQPSFSLDALPRASGGSSAIVVTAGFGLGPGAIDAGASVVFADPGVVSDTARRAERARPSALSRFFYFRYPAGADDNRVDWRSLLSAGPAPGFAEAAARRGAADVSQVARARGAHLLRFRRDGANLVLESA